MQLKLKERGPLGEVPEGRTPQMASGAPGREKPREAQSTGEQLGSQPPLTS